MRPVDLSHYARAQPSLHAEQEIALRVRVSRCLYDFIEEQAPTPDERQEAFEVLATSLNTTTTSVLTLIGNFALVTSNWPHIITATSPNSLRHGPIVE